MISQTLSTPLLVQQLINNKHSLFTIVTFMNYNDIKALYIAIRNNKTITITKEIDCLLTSFVFNKQYINKIDRTIAYFMYENHFVQQHDHLSILNVAQNSTQEVQNIMNSYQSLFKSLTQRCNMQQQEVNSLIRIVTQPDLPLPFSIRSQIGKYCNSNFQLFLSAKATKTQSFFAPQSQFQQFKTHILDNQDNYLIDILSSTLHHETQSFSLVQKIKQLCHNPEAFVQNLSINTQEYSKKNQLFNFFVIMVKISKNMVKSIKLRLQSVSYDPYVHFTEIMLRYSLYKFSMLELEESFAPIFTSFESIVKQALNITKMRHQVNQISIWKIMMSIFRSELDQEMKNAIPVYINLAHKLKVAQNNELYQKLGISQEKQNVSQYFQQYEGSPVLEYLMSEQNIDNAQVYMSDFVQMLIDLSVDQYNVLLCGHSEQFLGGIYEQWEEAFVSYQAQILDQLSSSSQVIQQKHFIESQKQFMSKKLNIKPRTVKYLLDRINNNNNRVQINFQQVDRQLTEINKRYFGQSYDLHNSQKSHKSSLTADDSDKQENFQIDLEGLEYFSQIDEEQIIEQIDV